MPETMKIYTELITLQSQKQREVINLTTQVKAALEKSSFRDGIILVSVLHSNSALIVNDDEPGLLEDLDAWLRLIAPERDDFKHKGRFESTSAVHFQSLLLHHQVVVGFTEGRLDLGPWQAILFVELHGLRPKRILVKVMGE
ncbi:MAG TPA: secondary thiamine-phosphate synthase enzyme YjbQ [archaeon]|nr:secondary thiamine-phosphate synthase enzyme YjbQ [archaeon]